MYNLLMAPQESTQDLFKTLNNVFPRYICSWFLKSVLFIPFFRELVYQLDANLNEPGYFNILISAKYSVYERLLIQSIWFSVEAEYAQAESTYQ